MKNKSIRKRIKFTKQGKVLRRKAGQNHFNAKESRRAQGRKKNMTGFGKGYEKNIIQYAARVK
jgi:ribosomal protein L35